MTDSQLLELSKNPHYNFTPEQLKRLQQIQEQPFQQHDLSFGAHELGFNRTEQITKIQGRREFGGDRKSL